MARLKIIQAAHGDCFLLEYSAGRQIKNMLIDGGPSGTFIRHLKNILADVDSKGQIINYLVLSHVDSDHISGLLDLLFEIDNQRINSKKELIAIDQIWANTFQNTIGSDNNIVNRFQALMLPVNKMNLVMEHSAMDILGINQGNKLRLQALKLHIDLNRGFQDGLISVETLNDKAVEDGELKITLLGPNKENLEELKSEWIKWLDRHEDIILSANFDLMAKADDSKPNLSSIMFLAEVDGTTILFTGDGRSDHLFNALKYRGMLDPENKVHFDFFKIPHHASDRNMTRSFLNKVTADTYIISANGRDNNPDLATLIWIVESARERQAQIKLIITNKTFSTQKLIEEYPELEYGYIVIFLEEGESYLDLEL